MSPDRERALAWVQSWIDSDALASVVDLYEGKVPDGIDLAGRLEWFLDFSERWDFRQGRERNLVESVDFSIDDAALVLEAAEKLGLRGSTRPEGSRFDHVVILGGLARACVSRPREAARLLDQEGVQAGHLVALGGFRGLKGNEDDLIHEFLGVDVVDEYEAMDAGIRSAFDLGEATEVSGETFEQLGASWSVRRYESKDAIPVHVAAAPSSEPGLRRANTADTYRWLASESGWIETGSSMLLITTNIYRPYQQADAIRMLTLPFGVEVEVFGGLPGASDSRLSKAFRPHDYLQEFRSTIGAMSRLREAIEFSD